MATDNHNLSKPERGVTGWDTDWYQNFDYLDTNAEIRDEEANRSAYVAKVGAKYFSTDTENVFLGTSSGWSRVDTAGPNPSFDSVDTDTLAAVDTTTDTIDAEDELILPVYDSTSEASSTTGSLIYITGVDDPAGVYRYGSTGYERLGSDGGDGDGASALSELSIDVNKDWRGYDITNVGVVSAGTGEFDDGSAATFQVSTAPSATTDVARLQELNDKADDPHGNEAHSEDYVTEDQLTDTTGAPSPHDNEHHSETYATTTQVDARAEDPHDNESHSTNYSPTSHDHSGRTIRPTAVEANSVQTGSILGSVTGNDEIDTLTGDNLYVSEGTLHANTGSTATGAMHVEYHDIDDYGADPTGSSYSDSALSSAISSLSDGDWLVMTQGNYRFQDAHTITNDYITVSGEGSLLIIEESDEYGSSDGFLAFKGSSNGSGNPDTTNSSAIQRGDQAITVNSAAGFSVGDDVIISQQKGPDNTHYRWGGQSGRTVAQTRSTIRHISGNTLYLTRGSSYFHSSGSAGVYQIDPCIRPRVFDLHMRSSGGAETETFLVFYMTRHGEMRRCYCQNITGFAYQFFYDFRPYIIDCVAKHPVEHSTRGSSQNEQMRIVGGTDHVFIRPIIEDCRRGIDLNAGADCVNIYEPLITNAQLHGVCFHSQNYSSGDGDVYGSYKIFGGRIECKQDSPENDLAHIGLGASMSRQQLGVTIIGTTIIGRTAAVHTPGYAEGEADNVTIKNCTLETVPGYSGGDLVRVGGTNWTIEGCDLRPNGGQAAITNSGSGFDNLKIMNNTIEGDIDLGSVTIDGYWFKNNYWAGGGSAPGGSGHYVRDNY